MIARQLGPDSAFSMAEIHARAFPNAWSVSDMAAHIQTDIVWGIGDPLCGFIIIQSAADQAEVLTIAVDPNHRNGGIGKTLLKAGENAARMAGAVVMFLEVSEDNTPARALYRRAGYQQIGRRPGYYKRPEGRFAALTFRKTLDDTRRTA